MCFILILTFIFRCAGLCCYEGRGGLCSIRLSKPLLTLRPRKDLVETLLVNYEHEYYERYLNGFRDLSSQLSCYLSMTSISYFENKFP